MQYNSIQHSCKQGANIPQTSGCYGLESQGVLNGLSAAVFMVFGVSHREWSSSPSACSSLSWSATLSCTGFPFTSQMLVSLHTHAEKASHFKCWYRRFDTTLVFHLTVHFDAKDAGDLSTLFDVGGIVGKLELQLVRSHSAGCGCKHALSYWWCFVCRRLYCLSNAICTQNSIFCIFCKLNKLIVCFSDE